MRCHPFFGIIDPRAVGVAAPDLSPDNEPDGKGRRTFLGQLAGLFAGGLGLFAVRPSAAQQAAVRVPSVVVTPSGPQIVAPGGSAGSSNEPRTRGGGTYTTQAIGEEGGTVTTYALGEEGSTPPPSGNPPPGTVTTYALGEEGSTPPSSGNPPPGTVTTYAVGEEGGTVPRPPGTVTTQAVGEEGGVTRPRYYYRDTNRGRRYWYRY